MRLWFFMVRYVRLTGWVITLLMMLLTLVGVVLVIRLLMLVVTCLGFVVAGILFSSTFIGFFIAVSGAVVNHDGGPGTAPDPLVWSAGSIPKRRRLVHAVRDRAFLPGPPGLWDSNWVNIPASVINAADIALWPYTPGLIPLVSWLSGFLFLGSLHWPARGSRSWGWWYLLMWSLLSSV